MSLLLKYPDRSEISDLGNLKFAIKLFRKNGQFAGEFEVIKSLRYESQLLRYCRNVLSIPGSIWRDSGSERMERIKLIERFIDDVSEYDGDDEKDTKNTVNNNINYINTATFTSTKTIFGNNPIDRLNIKIDPLPPIHSIELEVLVNLSHLQHFLFYYRLPAAILIIGTTTSLLWIIISSYAFIKLLNMLLMLRTAEKEKSVEDPECESERESESEINSIDPINDTESINSILSVEFPPTESVANFIGDLRRRKFTNNNEAETFENEDTISIFNESSEEDQSVP